MFPIELEQLGNIVDSKAIFLQHSVLKMTQTKNERKPLVEAEPRKD